MITTANIFVIIQIFIYNKHISVGTFKECYLGKFISFKTLKHLIKIIIHYSHQEQNVIIYI